MNLALILHYSPSNAVAQLNAKQNNVQFPPTTATNLFIVCASFKCIPDLVSRPSPLPVNDRFDPGGKGGVSDRKNELEVLPCGFCPKR